MQRSRVKELYYITPIENLPSIVKVGILSHTASKKLRCKSIADPEIQKRREKQVPGTEKEPHDYANLYFNPRNPMMFKRKDLHQEICVLRVNSSVLDLPGVIVTDGNASSGYAGFYESPGGLRHLDGDLIYATDWTDDNQFEAWRRKRCICAEVLVPDPVAVGFIDGIYVSCSASLDKVKQLLRDHPLCENLSINADLFFK